MPRSKPKLVSPAPENASGEAGPVAAPTAQRTTWLEDKQLSFYVLLALTGGAVYLTYIISRPFLNALFVALIMAIAVFPLHKWFVRRIRNTYVAALITTTLAVLLILVPLVFVSARLVAEATNIYSSVLRPLGNPSTWPRRLDPLIEKAVRETGVPAEQLKAGINTRTRELGTWVLGFAASFGRSFARQLTTVGLASVFLFSLLRSGDEFRVGALSMLPLSPHRARELAVAVSQGIIADNFLAAPKRRKRESTPARRQRKADRKETPQWSPTGKVSATQPARSQLHQGNLCSISDSYVGMSW
jgi:lysylphosphatidylglycerol synthetase-like protein (DUF2156 family)